MLRLLRTPSSALLAPKSECHSQTSALPDVMEGWFGRDRIAGTLFLAANEADFRYVAANWPALLPENLALGQ